MPKKKWIWFPERQSVLVEKNKNYLNSLFVGITAPILLLPELIFVEIIFPLIDGILTILICLTYVPIMGIMGYITPREQKDIHIRVSKPNIEGEDKQDKE